MLWSVNLLDTGQRISKLLFLFGIAGFWFSIITVVAVASLNSSLGGNWIEWYWFYLNYNLNINLSTSRVSPLVASKSVQIAKEESSHSRLW